MASASQAKSNETPLAFPVSVNGKPVRFYKWAREPDWRMYTESELTAPETREAARLLRAEHSGAAITHCGTR